MYHVVLTSWKLLVHIRVAERPPTFNAQIIASLAGIPLDVRPGIYPQGSARERKDEEQGRHAGAERPGHRLDLDVQIANYLRFSGRPETLILT